MFTARGQLALWSTVLAAVVIAAIPVTITFAQAGYSYGPYGQYQPYQGNGSTYQQPQYQTQPNYQLYWCNGYYSYSPCPTQKTHQQYYPKQKYPHTAYQYNPNYSYPSYQQPQYSYTYPAYTQLSYPMQYSYGSYSYNLNYNYNYSAWGGGSYWY